MADDKTKQGATDRARINVHEEHELRDWSKTLGVTKEKLIETVKEVGTSAGAVKKALGK